MSAVAYDLVPLRLPSVKTMSPKSEDEEDGVVENEGEAKAVEAAISEYRHTTF